jgi:hypothetical protein
MNTNSSKTTRLHRRGGRPRLATDARRGVALRVRVTPTEHQRVRAQAYDLGVTVGELIRRLVLNRRVSAIPSINREEWGRLGHLAANLNQYVKAIHQGQAAGAPLVLLEQLRTEVAALRQALLGDDPKD